METGKTAFKRSVLIGQFRAKETRPVVTKSRVRIGLRPFKLTWSIQPGTHGLDQLPGRETSSAFHIGQKPCSHWT